MVNFLSSLRTSSKIKKAGIEIDYVQPGNEITHGMLWPYAKLMGGEEKEASYDRFALSLNTAIEAIHEVYPSAKIILHLEQKFKTVYSISDLKKGLSFFERR